jgi:hypothetical protein
MPVGLYTRKGKNGRTMYFRDGKLISKKSYTASRSRRSASRSSTRRKRSTGNPRRKTNMARYRRPAMPHPSVTGLAAGLSVASYLDTGFGKKSPGVIKALQESKISKAFNELTTNSIDLVSSDSGKKVLTTAIIVAAGGGLIRKWFPSIKLGGQKIYMRI